VRYDGVGTGGSGRMKVLVDVEGIEMLGNGRLGRADTSASIDISGSVESDDWARATRASAQMNSGRPRAGLSRVVRCIIYSYISYWTLDGQRQTAHLFDSSCR
jgi:hypothetical protein